MCGHTGLQAWHGWVHYMRLPQWCHCLLAGCTLQMRTRHKPLRPAVTRRVIPLLRRCLGCICRIRGCQGEGFTQEEKSGIAERQATMVLHDAHHQALVGAAGVVHTPASPIPPRWTALSPTHVRGDAACVIKGASAQRIICAKAHGVHPVAMALQAVAREGEARTRGGCRNMVMKNAHDSSTKCSDSLSTAAITWPLNTHSPADHAAISGSPHVDAAVACRAVDKAIAAPLDLSDGLRVVAHGEQAAPAGVPQGEVSKKRGLVACGEGDVL